MAAPADRPSLPELFGVFFRISAVTIGGGYVMFPLLMREVVEDRQWITGEEMLDYYGLGQSIPGIIAMNTATLVGYRKRGVVGAVAAALGMAAPSLIVILLIAMFLTPWFDHPLVQKAFSGIRAAVVALLISAVWRVAHKSVTSPMRAAIAVCSMLAIAGLGWSPVLMIVAGALLGILLFRDAEVTE